MQEARFEPQRYLLILSAILIVIIAIPFSILASTVGEFIQLKDCDAVVISHDMTKKADNPQKGFDQSMASNEQKDAEKGRWWIGQIITIVGIIIGALIVIWKLRENFREQLRLNIFNEINSKIEAANTAYIKANTFASFVPIKLSLYKNQIEMGFNPVPIKDRVLNFHELHFNAKDTFSALLGIFEKYEIVNPNLVIFKTAFSAANYDVDKAFEALSSEFAKYLPMDVAESEIQRIGTNIIVPTLPNDDQLSQLKALERAYSDKMTDILSYLYDLKIEAQNLFLGKLFKNRVPSRQPLDPECIVITTDQNKIKELERYFKEDTPWGKNIKQVNSDVKAKIFNRNCAGNPE